MERLNACEGRSYIYQLCTRLSILCVFYVRSMCKCHVPSFFLHFANCFVPCGLACIPQVNHQKQKIEDGILEAQHWTTRALEDPGGISFPDLPMPTFSYSTSCNQTFETNPWSFKAWLIMAWVAHFSQWPKSVASLWGGLNLPLWWGSGGWWKGRMWRNSCVSVHSNLSVLGSVLGTLLGNLLEKGNIWVHYFKSSRK